MGDEAALSVYKQLLDHTVSITKDLPVVKTVFYSNFLEPADVWQDSRYKKQLQEGSGLGERMRHAFEYSFKQGIKKTVIIGTDCFELSSAIIINAFAYLDSNDVVLGPAHDGGYYLLAMKENQPQLFENISWSTEEVLEQTLSICKELNLSVFQLPVLADIDNEEDLKRFNSQTSQQQNQVI